MNEKDITKLCIAVSLAGILIIYVADVGLSPERITGKDISGERIGDKVLLCGKVTDFRANENGDVFFKLDDGAKTDVVLFKNRANYAALSIITEGSEACVAGTLEEYMGRMEILASKAIKPESS